MADYDYRVEKVLRVVDGDTMDLILSGDFGFHLTFQAFVRVRLLDIDTPEKNKPDQHETAMKAQIFTTDWLTRNIDSLRAATKKEDSFGRWLTVVYSTDNGETLADALYSAGFQKLGSKYGPK